MFGAGKKWDGAGRATAQRKRFLWKPEIIPVSFNAGIWSRVPAITGE
jgi:hypothetical protein